MIELSARNSEIAVLATILIHNDLMDTLTFLEPEHFHNVHHQCYFRTMRELRIESKPIDVISLHNKLGFDWVMKLNNTLAGNSCTPVSIDYHARIIFDRYRRRQIVDAANQAVMMCSRVDNADELIPSVKSLFENASDGIPIEDIRPIADVMSDVIGHVQSGSESNRMVKTGIENLDRITGGLSRSLVTVLAARPSMGKSTMLVNVMQNMAWSGNSVILSSLEDTDHYIGLRLLARTAGINYLKLVHGHTSDYEKSTLVEAASKICNGKIWIDDKPGRTVESLRMIAMEYKKKHDLDVLIIDHLGEFTNESDSYKSTSLNMRLIRNIAKELDIAVLLACQLNRSTTRRDGNRPVLSDLRDSGRIEEVARAVWFLHRPDYYDDNSESAQHVPEKDLDVIIAKASHGKTGIVKLSVDFSRMSIW